MMSAPVADASGSEPVHGRNRRSAAAKRPLRKGSSRAANGSSARPEETPLALRLRVERAARTLRAGGVVAYPTEAVYGIGCLPEDERAVARILRIKRRSWRKGMLVIGATLEQIARYADLSSSPLQAEILASWPGPNTWVLPARPAASPLVTGGRRTIAVRLTAHPLSAALCRRAGGALVSTSANSAGVPPLRSARAVRCVLGASLDDVVGGPLGDRASPTTIRDGISGALLRA